MFAIGPIDGEVVTGALVALECPGSGGALAFPPLLDDMRPRRERRCAPNRTRGQKTKCSGRSCQSE